MLANNLENVPLLGHAASERSAIRDRRVTAFTKFQFGAVLTKQVRDVKRKKRSHWQRKTIAIHNPFREESTANQPQKTPLPENRQSSKEEIMLSLVQIKLSVSDFTNFVHNSLHGYLKARCDNFRARCVSHSLQACGVS